jgi:hypothetical protein
MIPFAERPRVPAKSRAVRLLPRRGQSTDTLLAAGNCPIATAGFDETLCALLPAGQIGCEDVRAASRDGYRKRGANRGVS